MKKFAYLYNCYITLNGDRTNIEFHKFLDKIIPLTPDKRLRRIKDGDFTSKAMMPDTDVATNRNRKIGFAKYRDRKPYEAAKGTDLAELIKKDVLEMTSAVFIPEGRLVAIEYNHHGPRAKAIANYLSSFLPSNDNQLWNVELVPVETKLGWQDISNSNDIRLITIKLDVAGKSKNFISKQTESESLLVKLIQQTVKSNMEFGANTATIVFGNGRQRSGIQSKQLLPLLELLEFSSDLFETVKIKYKSPETKQVEMVDLKNDGVRSIILENVDKNNNWEYICDQISDVFYEEKKPGINNFSKHVPFKPVVLPDIIK
jgi:hypothetical protein